MAVLPDANLEKVGDIFLPVHGEEQHDFSIKGVVVGVGKKFFYPFHNEKNESSMTYWHRHYNDATVSYDCPHEIKPGDRVLFHHNAHYDGYDGLLLMKRDMIFSVNEQAVNGWVLFEMDEWKMEGNIIIPRYDKNNYGVGRVVTKSPLGAYNDWHYEGEFEGKIIHFDKRSASRLELDYHNSLTNKQSSLFKIQRKDIYYAERD